MKDNTIKSELPALVKAAGAERLDKKRAEIRERAKTVLAHKERMENSIAECEKDLAEAKKKLAEFEAKLALVDAEDLEAFKELEKIIREGETKLYVPCVTYGQNFYQHYPCPTAACIHTLTLGSGNNA